MRAFALVLLGACVATADPKESATPPSRKARHDLALSLPEPPAPPTGDAAIDVFEAECWTYNKKCEVLGWMHVSSHPDREKAAKAFGHGCDDLHDVRTCEAWAVALRGRELGPDRAGAAVANEKACQLGSHYGCYGVALDIYEGVLTKPSAKNAIEMWLRDCDAGGGDSCLAIADLIRANVIRGASPEEAHDFVAKACRAANSSACARLR